MTDRELDALIAEKVMGFGRRTNCHYQDSWIYPDGRFGSPPNYSTSIADAWEVVEKMKEEYTFNITDFAKDSCMVHFRQKSAKRNFGMETDSTAPKAIVMAALKAKGLM